MGRALRTDIPTLSKNLRDSHSEVDRAFYLAFRAHQAFSSVHFIGRISGSYRMDRCSSSNAWFDSDLTVVPHGTTLSDTNLFPTTITIGWGATWAHAPRSQRLRFSI